MKCTHRVPIFIYFIFKDAKKKQAVLQFLFENGRSSKGEGGSLFLSSSLAPFTQFKLNEDVTYLYADSGIELS